VFQEQDAAARPEHAPHLGESLHWIVHRAQGEGDDGRVDGFGRERQGLGGRDDDLERHGAATPLPAPEAQEAFVRVDADDALDAGRIAKG